ncbi:MAG: CheR family methyltransferase [Opitutaceae bacterium]
MQHNGQKSDLPGAPDTGGADRRDSSERDAIRTLVTDIYEHTGADFREYAYSSLRRRVARCVADECVPDVGELHRRMLGDPRCLQRVLKSITVHVTSMFRDPGFFLALRATIVPLLRTYPFVRIWSAGCSTGEELFSLAIVLHEEGLLDRCRLYATDMSVHAIEKARAGIFPLSAMRDYLRNYQAGGGREPFSDYYTADGENVILRPFLRKNVVFSSHNLASDASFNEFHAIFCRNVLIYFNRALQDRVHALFHESLVHYGFLGLGRSESIRFTPFEKSYESVGGRERIFRKVK